MTNSGNHGRRFVKINTGRTDVDEISLVMEPKSFVRTVTKRVFDLVRGIAGMSIKLWKSRTDGESSSLADSDDRQPAAKKRRLSNNATQTPVNITSICSPRTGKRKVEKA